MPAVPSTNGRESSPARLGRRSTMPCTPGCRPGRVHRAAAPPIGREGSPRRLGPTRRGTPWCLLRRGVAHSGRSTLCRPLGSGHVAVHVMPGGQRVSEAGVLEADHPSEAARGRSDGSCGLGADRRTRWSLCAGRLGGVPTGNPRVVQDGDEDRAQHQRDAVASALCSRSGVPLDPRRR